MLRQHLRADQFPREQEGQLGECSAEDTEAPRLIQAENKPRAKQTHEFCCGQAPLSCPCQAQTPYVTTEAKLCES